VVKVGIEALVLKFESFDLGLVLKLESFDLRFKET